MIETGISKASCSAMYLLLGFALFRLPGSAFGYDGGSLQQRHETHILARAYGVQRGENKVKEE